MTSSPASICLSSSHFEARGGLQPHTLHPQQCLQTGLSRKSPLIRQAPPVCGLPIFQGA